MLTFTAFSLSSFKQNLFTFPLLSSSSSPSLSHLKRSPSPSSSPLFSSPSSTFRLQKWPTSLSNSSSSSTPYSVPISSSVGYVANYFEAKEACGAGYPGGHTEFWGFGDAREGYCGGDIEIPVEKKRKLSEISNNDGLGTSRVAAETNNHSRVEDLDEDDGVAFISDGDSRH
ncbi:hypothetical protein BT93_H0176 [Corymbia citriodora subsp. variegata]|nr:hypothetical protein BT93_H0176 [Corymbia citriodora subsp. variegata]